MNDHWSEPVCFDDGKLRITIATPAQACSFIHHTHLNGAAWDEALRACSAAAEGRLSNTEAKQAFLKAAH